MAGQVFIQHVAAGGRKPLGLSVLLNLFVGNGEEILHIQVEIVLQAYFVDFFIIYRFSVQRKFPEAMSLPIVYNANSLGELEELTVRAVPDLVAEHI